MLPGPGGQSHTVDVHSGAPVNEASVSLTTPPLGGMRRTPTGRASTPTEVAHSPTPCIGLSVQRSESSR